MTQSWLVSGQVSDDLTDKNSSLWAHLGSPNFGEGVHGSNGSEMSGSAGSTEGWVGGQKKAKWQLVSIISAKVESKAARPITTLLAISGNSWLK